MVQRQQLADAAHAEPADLDQLQQGDLRAGEALIVDGAQRHLRAQQRPQQDVERGLVVLSRRATGTSPRKQAPVSDPVDGPARGALSDAGDAGEGQVPVNRLIDLMVWSQFRQIY